MSSESRIPHTSIRMGEDLQAQTQKMAEQLGLSMNKYVIEAIVAYNARQRLTVPGCDITDEVECEQGLEDGEF